MKLHRKILGLVMVFAMAFGTSAAFANANADKRIENAVGALKNMIEVEDSESMAEVLEQGVGLAIFPNLVKAGFIIGGQYGQGLVVRYDKDTKTWYGPAFYNMTGGSIGLQIGAANTAVFLVIMNEDGMKGFRGDNFTLGGSLGIAAGPVGRAGTAATDINLNTPIFSYSLSKGLFAGMTFDGSSINFDGAVNEAYWGKKLTPEESLNRKATSTSQMRPLVEELNTLLKKAPKK